MHLAVLNFISFLGQIRLIRLLLGMWQIMVYSRFYSKIFFFLEFIMLFFLLHHSFIPSAPGKVFSSDKCKPSSIQLDIIVNHSTATPCKIP